MRYVLRQKFLAWGHDFRIQDDTERDVFLVKDKVFNIAYKLSLQDMQGNELALIQKRLLSWGTTYNIYGNQSLCATVKEPMFILFRRKFTVDISGSDKLKVKGNFLDYEYTFNQAGSVVAEVSKKWFKFPNTYGINISDDQDDMLILACTVVIDMVSQGR